MLLKVSTNWTKWKKQKLLRRLSFMTSLFFKYFVFSLVSYFSHPCGICDTIDIHQYVQVDNPVAYVCADSRIYNATEWYICQVKFFFSPSGIRFQFFPDVWMELVWKWEELVVRTIRSKVHYCFHWILFAFYHQEMPLKKSNPSPVTC